MRPSPPLPPKKEVALALLAHSSVFIHLDPRVANVVVPPWFKKQPQLVLQVGLNMPVPIHDLHLDDDGLSCTLSFNRAPFHCMVPWTAVFAMVDDEGRAMVWPDDVPPEVQQQVRVRAVEAVPSPPATSGAAGTTPSTPTLVASGGESSPKKDMRRPRLEEVKTEGSPERQGGKKKGKNKGDASPTEPGRLSAVPSPARSTPAAGKGRGDGAPQAAPARLSTLSPLAGGGGASSGGKSGSRHLEKSAAPNSGSKGNSAAAMTGFGSSKDGQDPEQEAREANEAHDQAAAKPKPGAGARKGKRELPPYLRVVK